MFLSITGVTPDNKIAKYQPFTLEADAIAHALEYNGFSAPDPGGIMEFWVVDTVAKTVTQDTVTETATLTARAWDRVRSKRNALLAATDYRFRSDQTPSAAWVTYSQALRDITTQADPSNITWPTEPV